MLLQSDLRCKSSTCCIGFPLWCSNGNFYRPRGGEKQSCISSQKRRWDYFWIDSRYFRTLAMRNFANAALPGSSGRKMGPHSGMSVPP